MDKYTVSNRRLCRTIPGRTPWFPEKVRLGVAITRSFREPEFELMMLRKPCFSFALFTLPVRDDLGFGNCARVQLVPKSTPRGLSKISYLFDRCIR